MYELFFLSRNITFDLLSAYLIYSQIIARDIASILKKNFKALCNILIFMKSRVFVFSIILKPLIMLRVLGHNSLKQLKRLDLIF